MNIPVIYYNVNLDDDITGLKRVSSVYDPAIDIEFDLFNELKDDMFKVEQDKRIVKGPAMIPNKKMLRKTRDGKYYYAVFTEEAIENTVKKASKNGVLNEMNLEHIQDEGGKIKSAVMIESYFIAEKDATEEIPKGSWITSYWIENEKEWEIIKDGGYKGFSVEITAELIPEEEMKFSKDNSLEDMVFNILNSNLDEDNKELIIKRLINII